MLLLDGMRVVRRKRGGGGWKTMQSMGRQAGDLGQRGWERVGEQRRVWPAFMNRPDQQRAELNSRKLKSWRQCQTDSSFYSSAQPLLTSFIWNIVLASSFKMWTYCDFKKRKSWTTISIQETTPPVFLRLANVWITSDPTSFSLIIPTASASWKASGIICKLAKSDFFFLGQWKHHKTTFNWHQLLSPFELIRWTC